MDKIYHRRQSSCNDSDGEKYHCRLDRDIAAAPSSSSPSPLVPRGLAASSIRSMNSTYRRSAAASTTSTSTSRKPAAATTTTTRTRGDAGREDNGVISRVNSTGGDVKRRKFNNINNNAFSRSFIMLCWIALLGVISVVRVLWGSFSVVSSGQSFYWRRQQRVKEVENDDRNRHEGRPLRAAARPTPEVSSLERSETSSKSRDDDNLRHHRSQQHMTTVTRREQYNHPEDFIAKRTIQRRDSSRPTIDTTIHHTSLEEPMSGHPTMGDMCEFLTLISSSGGSRGQKQRRHREEQEYTSESRILISGFLVHPVAVELALKMAEQFSIQQIVGLGTKPTNVLQSSRLEFVMRQLPYLDVQLSRYYPPSEQQIHDVVHSLQPTHIFHFIVDGDDDGDEYARGAGANIYDIQRDLSILHSICKSMITRATSREKQPSSTKLIVVRLDVPIKVSSHASGIATSKFSSMKQRLHSTVLQTYRIHYHLNIRQVNLPYLFGPYEEGNAPIIQLLESIEQSTFDVIDNGRADSVQNDRWMYFADGVKTIELSSRRQNEQTARLPVFGADDSDTTTRGNISVSLKNIFSTNDSKKARATTSQDDNLHALVSWFSLMKNPYGLKRSTITLPSSENKPRNDWENLTDSAGRTTESIFSNPQNSLVLSQDERRKHGLFPCSSECASRTSNCIEESVWSVDVVSASRIATQECRYLLYMADFSRNLKEVPLMKEAPNGPQWPKNLFCQVAFVAKGSPLVSKTIKSWKKDILQSDVGLDQGYSELNGLLSVNEWKLVWVDHNEDHLSEADLMLPKLAPGDLVSTNVTKAFYVELQHLRMVPPLQVIWFLMARKLDAKALQARRVRETRSGTSTGRFVDAPAVPARHVTLFSHKFNLPHEVSTGHDDRSLVSFLLKQKGRRDSRRKWTAFRRQWEAYSHSISLWSEDDPTLFQLVDTTIIIHRIDGPGSSRSRRLRCEWYDEHLFWNDNVTKSNRHLEDISLSYVLSRRRKRGWLQYADDTWGEKMLEEDAVGFVDVQGKIDDLQASNTTDLLHDDYFISLHDQLKARKEY